MLAAIFAAIFAAILAAILAARARILLLITALRCADRRNAMIKHSVQGLVVTSFGENAAEALMAMGNDQVMKANAPGSGSRLKAARGGSSHIAQMQPVRRPERIGAATRFREGAGACVALRLAGIDPAAHTLPLRQVRGGRPVLS